MSSGVSPISESPRLDCQTNYWNTAGVTKRFTHPLHLEWLTHAGTNGRVLDYGCGYGRTLEMLRHAGWSDLVGVDIAPAFVRRAQARVPTATIHVVNDPPRIPYSDESFDVALLIAVLTCVPSNSGQRDLVAQLCRVLRPGGLLYVSDVLLQSDARNTARYERFADMQDAPYGTFRTDDGAICRHHSKEWLRELFTSLETVEEHDAAAQTMNGNSVTTTQMLLRLP